MGEKFKYMCKLKSLVIFTGLFLLASVSSLAFFDVNSNTTNQEAIDFLAGQGIISGYADGTFKPDNTLNRAELLKILIGATTKEQISAEQYKNCFSDVKDEWFAKYVCYAKEKGIINGYSDGTFKPSQTINFAEVAKIIVNAFDLETVADSTAWYAGYVKVLSDKKAIPKTITRFYLPINRQEMAEIVYRLKEDIQDKEFTTYEALVSVLMPEYLPEMKKIPLETFVKDIMQLDITAEEYQKRFQEDEKNIWEIYKVGTVKIPDEGEKDLYAIRYVYNTPIKEDNGEIRLFPDDFKFYLGYVSDKKIFYFDNASYIKFSFVNGQAEGFRREETVLIANLSIGGLSSEYKQLSLPNSPHKLALAGNMFSCSDPLIEAIFDTNVLEPYFYINNDLSVWKPSKGTNYYYVVKDRLNTCSVYNIYYDYYLSRLDLDVHLNLSLKDKDITNLAYFPHRRAFENGGRPGAYSSSPVNIYSYVSIPTSDKNLSEYLEYVDSTATGEKIYVLSDKTPLLCDEFHMGLGLWCTHYSNEKFADDDKLHDVMDIVTLAFVNYINQKYPDFSFSDRTYDKTRDKTAENKEFFKEKWPEFLIFQKTEYPLLFIEDSFEGFILFTEDSFSYSFWI